MSISRTRPPTVADEPTMLRAFLDFYRATLRQKVEGLDTAQLAQPIGPPHPSTLTLGGLLKHLSYVEDFWTGVNLAGGAFSPPFDQVERDTIREWVWTSAVDDDADTLRDLLDRVIARADAVLDETESLDVLATRPHPYSGEPISARWIVLHLIDEYARHVGHADLLRESIDGATGL